MTYKAKKYMSAILALVSVAEIVSCNKIPHAEPGPEEAVFPDAEGVMVLNPVIESTTTKTITDGGDLPEEYTIFLSSYFYNGTDGSTSNYFKARPFNRNDGGRWGSNPVSFWPLGGYLDMLALAADADVLDVEGAAEWNSGNVTSGVEIEVPDWETLDSELMYGKASSKNNPSECVSMKLYHSQSWIRIVVDSYPADATRIDSIVVRRPYVGGRFRVDNDVFLEASWYFRNHSRQDYEISEFRNYVVNDTKSVDFLLPEQDACDIYVYYTQKLPTEPSWDNYTRKTCGVCKASKDPWFAGRKTTYSLFILKDITIEVSVQDWGENGKTININ